MGTYTQETVESSTSSTSSSSSSSSSSDSDEPKKPSYTSTGKPISPRPAKVPISPYTSSTITTVGQKSLPGSRSPGPFVPGSRSPGTTTDAVGQQFISGLPNSGS